MTTQPYALCLAEALTPPTYPAWVMHIPPWHPRSDDVRAAAELRRLHAECEELRHDIRQLQAIANAEAGEAEALRADAERWRCFRTFVAGKSTRGFLNGKPAAYMVLPAITVERVGMTLDESIDAARAAKEQSK